MKRSINSLCFYICLFCLLLLSFGCATKSAPEEYSIQDKYAQQYFKEQDKAVLVPTAQSAIGTPYKFGGTDGNGFDCSGFVQWVYSYAGVKLPRTAREQSKLGISIKKQEDMQVGDIVAFYSRKRGYHTGIYVGDGKFVHSPRRRTKVRISDLSTSYFSKSFLSARRVVDDLKESEKEAAEKLLADYEKIVQEQSKAIAKSKKSKKKAVSNSKPKAKMVAKTKAKSKTKVVAKAKPKAKSKMVATKSKSKAKVVNKSKLKNVEKSNSRASTDSKAKVKNISQTSKNSTKNSPDKSNMTSGLVSHR